MTNDLDTGTNPLTALNERITQLTRERDEARAKLAEAYTRDDMRRAWDEGWEEGAGSSARFKEANPYEAKP
jgi:hypothetical protein